MPTAERRKHPRFIISLPLEINFAGEYFSTVTKNVSCAGIFCNVNKYIPQDSDIRVTMKLVFKVKNRKIQKTITCPARIIRIEPDKQQENEDYNIGLKFSKLLDQDKETLLQYIRQKNLKEAKELKKIYLKLKDMFMMLL